MLVLRLALYVHVDMYMVGLCMYMYIVHDRALYVHVFVHGGALYVHVFVHGGALYVHVHVHGGPLYVCVRPVGLSAHIPIISVLVSHTHHV